MKCKKCSALISDYLDESLSETLKDEFESHIAACRECAAELEASRALICALGGLSVATAPIDCWPGIRERILAAGSARTGRSHIGIRPAFAIPVFAIVVVVALMVFGPVLREGTDQGTLVSAPEFSRYISAHSVLQSQQTLTDPHVILITAELENASFSDTTKDR